VKLHIILAVLVPVAVAAAVSSLLYRSTHLGLVRHIIFPCTIRLRKDADAELGDKMTHAAPLQPTLDHASLSKSREEAAPEWRDGPITCSALFQVDADMEARLQPKQEPTRAKQGANSVTPQYANESKARRAGAEDGPVGDGDGDGGNEANTARNAQPKAAPAQLAGANDGPAGDGDGDGDGDGAGKANAAGNARVVGVPSSIEKKMELAARRQALEKSKAIISALNEPLPRRHGCGPI